MPMDPGHGTSIIETTTQSRSPASSSPTSPSGLPYGSNSGNDHDRLSVTSTPLALEDGYDPNRIPSSVFSSNPSSGMDWSCASNESLFSISMGHSFSGYPVMFKSEELGMYEGLYNPQSPFEGKTNEGSNYFPNLPTLPETSHEPEMQQSAYTKDDTRIQEVPSNSSSQRKDEIKETHGYKSHVQENVAPPCIPASKGGSAPIELTNSSRNSAKPRLSTESPKTNSPKNRLSTGSSKSSGSKNRLSNDSGRSYSSFAFPVLVHDVGKPSSFNIKSDKKDVHPMEHRFEPPRPATPPKSPPTTQATPTGRGCLSCIPGWLRCC